MTKQELSQKIKAKYPQYKDIDDNVLADKILEKYPVYKSQISEQSLVKNIKSDLGKRSESVRKSLMSSNTNLIS